MMILAMQAPTRPMLPPGAPTETYYGRYNADKINALAASNTKIILKLLFYGTPDKPQCK